MSKASFSLFFGACVALVTAGSPLAEAGSSVSAVKVPLALNWKPDPEFGGFYAAAAIPNRGIDFELIPGGSGTPVVQMVAAGKTEFGIASADEVVIARSRGADVVALFAVYQTNPQAIMSHADQGYKSLAEVYAAKTPLAIQKGLPYALFLAKKFSANTHALVVPYLGGIENFLADKTYSQQGFATVEPLAAEKKGVRVKTFLVADEGYNPYTTVLITRGDVLAHKEAYVKQVVAAVRAGWREYQDHPETTNQSMARLNTSMDLATYTAGANAQRKLIEPDSRPGLGVMTVARWVELRDQMVALKLIPANEQKKDAQAYFRNL